MLTTTEFVILGTSGMNRDLPSQLLLGEDGKPWPCRDAVGVNPGAYPVVVLRLAFVDVGMNTTTDLPFRKTSSL